MENQQTSENCFIQGLKLAHQSFAEFVNYFSPLLASRSSIAPSSEVWQYAERREGEREEEERGQIAYDKPEKKKKNNEGGKSFLPGQKENTYMDSMISLNDWTMIMQCIYNS